VSVPPVSGVLLLTGPKGQYQFDFSEASEACLLKNLSIASRSQLQTALDNGLEACRFGWISEQVAAVPRLSSVSTCGSGKTGVVTWNASPENQFGVWCFGRSDSNEAEKTTVGVSQTPTFYPTTTTAQRTSTLTSTAALTTTNTTTMTVTTTTNPTTKPRTTTRIRVTSAPWIHMTEKPKTVPSVSTQFPTMTSKSFMMIQSSSAAGSNVRDYSSNSAVTPASAKPPRSRGDFMNPMSLFHLQLFSFRFPSSRCRCDCSFIFFQRC
uniref:Link domain-containing protein n=1 Tax=Neogobius melanostomus TaxID=47308 RepID=A0A8C6S5I5_9GOBI